MKKTHFSLFIALAVLIIPTGMILAQSNQPIDFSAEATPLPLPPDTQPTPLPDVTEYDGKASFTFADIGEEDTVLRYPSQMNVYANFPNEWNMVPGGSGNVVHYGTGSTNTIASSPYSAGTFLELHYDFSDRSDEKDANAFYTNPVGNPYFWGDRPSIEVYVNGILAGTFVPEVGTDQRVQIPVPSILTFQKNENPYNEFDIQIAYYSDGDIFCNYDGILSIFADSTINTTYSWISPFRYPANLPRPLVQDSFVPEVLKIVVSDQPTPGEIKAIANIAAGLSRNSFGNVSYEVIPASQANSTTLADSNAVIIGSPENNTFLKQLYNGGLLPSTLATDGKNILAYDSNVDTDTGVLQIIPSSVNNLRTFVTITGESDLAVFRASDAFASPPIGATYQLLLVDTDYAKPVSTTTVTEETGADALRGLFSLANLGYRQRTAQGNGTQDFYVSFYVGRDWVLTDDITFKVNYSHSDTIDFNSSNAVVLMNNEPIGNLPISATPTEVMTQEITINKEDVIKGVVNVIRISASLSITNICEEYDPTAYWFTVFDDSEMTIPFTVSTNPIDVAPIMHPTIPFAFETSHVVIVNEDPKPAELTAIANFYNQLGSLNSNGYFDVTVIMSSDDIDLTKYPDHNIIVFGLPSETKFIENINEELPQPFIPGTNNLEQIIGQSAYQLVSGLEVGVIESIKSDNNPGRMITVMTGTSDAGFEWMMDEFSTNITGLIGDLFFIEETKTSSFTSSLFSQAVLDSMVSEALDQEEFVPVDEADTSDTTEESSLVSGETYIRPEDVNDTTTPFLMIAGIAAVGLILIIYIGTRIASGKRSKR